MPKGRLARLEGLPPLVAVNRVKSTEKQELIRSCRGDIAPSSERFRAVVLNPANWSLSRLRKSVEALRDLIAKPAKALDETGTGIAEAYPRFGEVSLIEIDGRFR